jgi:hypothetical protein
MGIGDTLISIDGAAFGCELPVLRLVGLFDPCVSLERTLLFEQLIDTLRIGAFRCRAILGIVEVKLETSTRLRLTS